MLDKIQEALNYYADDEMYEPFQTLHGERPAPILKMRSKLAKEALEDLKDYRKSLEGLQVQLANALGDRVYFIGGEQDETES